MRILVGTTAVQIPVDRSRPVIQNLGPGDLYLDTDGDVDANSGLKLIPTAVYEFPVAGAGMNVWVVATQASTDVRVIEIG